MSAWSVQDWIGTLGGLTGIASLIVSIAAFRRDRVHVRLECVRNMRVLQPDGGDELVRQELSHYRAANTHPPLALFYRDPDKLWCDFRIYNMGRRPVHITSIGFVRAGNPHYIVIPDFMVLHPGGVTIDEGKNINQLIDQVPLEAENRIRAAWALDAAGRRYFAAFPATLGGLIDRAKALLRARPFQRRW